jgi:hypothetical protein
MAHAAEGLDLERLRGALATRFPTLHVAEDASVLRGTMPIEHDGIELDRFAIEVELRPLSVTELPAVREIGGRIPWLAERHVNADGSACVCLPDDYFLRFPGPFDLLTFLAGPVRDYFLGQALVERGDPWPHGEWPHGTEGSSEWFTEFVKALPPETARAYLQTFALKELKGHVSCPCGSGRRVRACHWPLLQRLRGRIPMKLAREVLDDLRRRKFGPLASATETASPVTGTEADSESDRSSE